MYTGCTRALRVKSGTTDVVSLVAATINQELFIWFLQHTT